MATVLTAEQDYALFTTTLSTTDPVRSVAQVMLRMTNAQANLLRVLTDDVTRLTDKMAEVNDLMNTFNLALAKSGLSDTVAVQVVGAPDNSAASEALMVAFTQRVINAGGTTALAATSIYEGGEGILINHVNSSASEPWQVYGYKTPLTNISQNLQRTVDGLSSEVQQAQLTLQTLMGRYNGAFEVVTSSIKRSESQGQSVTGNIRR